MEEVYWNNSEYECEGESNGGSKSRVRRYVECAECAGIVSRYGFLQEIRVKIGNRSLGMFPRIGEVTLNVREDGSKSLCVEVRGARRCCVWVKLRCTWLEP